MNTTENWTKDKVKYWFAIAALTDRALVSILPHPAGWDEWNVIKQWYCLAWDDRFDDLKPNMPHTTEQQDIWHTVTGQWFKTIDSDQNKRIIWMRACRMSFPQIAKHLGLSRQNIIVRYETALGRLVERLNAMPDIDLESD